MAIYIVILAIILVGIVGHDMRSGASDACWRWVLIVLTAIMTLTAGLRYHCGIDTWMYESNFAWANSDEFDKSRSLGAIFSLRMEYLYHFLGQLGLGFWVVQLAYAVLLNSMAYLLTVRATRCWFTAFLFYLIFAYFPLNFEVMREGGAVAIGLWAWADWRKGAYGKYYLKVLLAVLIHLSGIFLAVLPLLRLPAMLRLTRSWVGVAAAVLGGLAFGWLMLALFREAAGSWLSGIASGYETQFDYKLSYYLEAWAHPMALNWKGILGFGAAYVGYPVLIWYMLGGGKGKEMDTESADLCAMLLGVVFISTLSFEFEILQRFRNYLILYYAVAFARSAYFRGGLWKRLGWWVIMCPLLLFGLNTFLAPQKFADGGRVYNLYIPYGNVIEKNENPIREAMQHEIYNNSGKLYGKDIRLE